MARAYWSGNLRISLVSIGVSLFTATETKSQITFRQIDRTTGERIRHQKVVESAVENREAATPIENHEIVKGYEYRKGQYIIIEPNELEGLRIESKHLIAISQFIDREELRPEYFEKPYYVTPEDEMQAESFNVIRQALQNTGKAAIGKLALSGRESIVAIMPAGEESRGMMAYTLRYENELRDQNDYFRDIQQPAIQQDSLELAETLIRKMAGRFDLSKYEDGWEVAVKALVEAKVKNLPLPIGDSPVESSGKVIDLMEALRRSIGKDGAAMKKPPKRERDIVKRPSGSVREIGKATSKRKSA
jgi:DNA end-binding protein Ku